MESLSQLQDILKSVIERPISSKTHTEMVDLATEVFDFKEVFEKHSKMIQDEIQDCNCFVQVYDEALRDLETKTRNLVLQLEDIIDSYLALLPEGRGVITCYTHIKINVLLKQLKTIRQEQLKPLLEDTRMRVGFPIRPYDYSPTTTKYIKAGQKLEEPPKQENLVCLEVVTETIVGFLLQEELERTGVYSIVGMPGIGKTTLASKVFHDPRIRNEFSIIVWASSLDSMIAALWEKLYKQEMPLKPLEELDEKIQHSLGTEKVLIFLDNVANWENIKKSVPMDHRFCKVLLTTSNLSVASEANPDGLAVKLQCMDGNAGWELLHLLVYGKSDDDSCPELEWVGKSIAKQCGGLPKAIAMIGKILAEKVSSVARNTKAAMRIWEEVAGNVQDYLFNPDIPENMEAFMSKYYYELPYKARDCLLYSSMLPNDKSLQKLIQLFYAEGLESLDDEDAARWHWHMLVSMNLLVLNQRSPGGFTFSLHSLVREFCKRKVASSEKGISLLQETKMSSNGAFEPPIQELEESYGVCVNSDVKEFLSEKPKLQNIRSFLCFSNKPIVLSENEHIHSITHAFGKLRVYEGKTIKFRNFPDKLTNLLHLRYVTLSGDKIDALPGSISKWHNIQTIKVYTSSPTLEIKANIWEMAQLRVLKTKAGIILKKDVKGKGGEKLENLGYLSVQSCNLQVAKKAKSLKTLRIRGQLSKLKDSRFLENLVALEKLKLVNEVKAEKGLLTTSESLMFPNQLENLSTTFLNWEHISSIVNQSLMVLQLKDIDFVGDCWHTGSNSFPKLELLIIEGTNLTYWTATDDSFPNLKTLVLKNCKKLKEVPLELGNNKLERLEMKNVSPAAVLSAIEMDNARKQMPDRHPLKLVLGPGDYLSMNRQHFYLDEPYSVSNIPRRRRRGTVTSKPRSTKLGW